MNRLLRTSLVSKVQSRTASSMVQPIRIHYQWQANINPSSGLANAVETSHKEYKAIHFQHEHLVNRIAKEFKLYPFFLQRKSVFLGILKVVQDEQNTFIKLNLPFIYFTLLKLGEPKTEFKWLTKEQDIASIAISTFIPIVGGCLTTCPKPGFVQFKSVCKYPKMSCTNLKDKEYSVKNLDLNVRLETRLVDYKPMIVGMPPIHPLRKFLYLNTQRYLHVYVMRRFHGHVYRMIASDIERVENDDEERDSSTCSGGGDSVLAQRFEFDRKSK